LIFLGNPLCAFNNHKLIQLWNHILKK